MVSPLTAETGGRSYATNHDPDKPQSIFFYTLVFLGEWLAGGLMGADAPVDFAPKVVAVAQAVMNRTENEGVCANGFGSCCQGVGDR